MRFFNPAFLSNIEFSISDMLDMTIIIWDLWLKLLITVLDIYGQCVFYWYNPNPPVVPCHFWWCSLLQLAARSRCEMLGSRQRICFRWTWDGVGGEDRRVLTVAFAADRLPSLRFGFGSYRIWFYNNNFFFILWNVMESEARDAHRRFTSVTRCPICLLQCQTWRVGFVTDGVGFGWCGCKYCVS